MLSTRLVAIDLSHLTALNHSEIGRGVFLIGGTMVRRNGISVRALRKGLA